MAWLQLTGSIKLYVSFATEPYQRDNILQKRPVIISILLIVAIPYLQALHWRRFLKLLFFYVMHPTRLVLHTYILRGNPTFYEKSPTYCGKTLHVTGITLHITERALHIAKRALYITKRALRLRKIPAYLRKKPLHVNQAPDQAPDKAPDKAPDISRSTQRNSIVPTNPISNPNKLNSHPSPLHVVKQPTRLKCPD